MMKERSEILQEILNLAKSELNENGDIGYTMPDGKYHIYISVESYYDWSSDGGKEKRYYLIEPNELFLQKDGKESYSEAIPMGENLTVDYDDFAGLLVACANCMEQFERDIERKKEIELQKDELVCVSKTRDFEMLKTKLNIESLRLIDNIYQDYNRGRVDLDVPKDKDGNFNFEDVKLVYKDPFYEETGFELVVLKWLEDMEDTGYLIDCLEESEDLLKTYEYVVDYLNPFTGKICSFEFSRVAEDYPSVEWLADQIFANLSESFSGVNYRKAVASIDCIGMQVTQNGEYVSGDELAGEELQGVLNKVIGFANNKCVSIEEQISVAQGLKSSNDKPESIKQPEISK